MTTRKAIRESSLSTRNYRLVAEGVYDANLSSVIMVSAFEAKQCSPDRQLKEIDFHVQNVEGRYNQFDVFVKAVYGEVHRE